MGTIAERTVVVFDRYPLWLDGLEQLLGRVGMRIVGRTNSAAEIPLLVDAHRPDLLIVDVSHDDPSALDEVAELRVTDRELRVVALADADDSMQIHAAFAAGADVVCARTAVAADLVGAVRQAFVRSIFVAHSEEDALARSARRGSTVRPLLTKRELEILRLVADGMSNSQLAQQLWVREQTVKFHLSNIYRKLGVANRTEAGRWAQLNGVLSSAAAGSDAAPV